ncbi:hypothetical protein [Desulfitobacterium hafniense]|uniref:hypothetical protein n=1 Tax=Desulfitobacterium hafniense TaxID=49338 RepID=UPI00037FFFA3|nr:hypothetical protein [Desulfitobacterium hafniense]
MHLKDVIEEFISENPNYKHDIINFISYLTEYKKLPLDDTVFGGVNTDHVIDSLKHYIDIGQFKTVSIVQKYTVVISKFFIYAIVAKNSLKNSNILDEISAPKIDEKSYYSRINLMISKNKKLSTKEPILVFSREIIEDIITNCDLIIQDTGKHNNKIGFEKLVAALCIKLVVLTGMKYGIARKIRVEDLNVTTNTIHINGFNIRLPLKLSTQFQYYMELRESFGKKCSFLFMSFDGEQWGGQTSASKMPDMLARWTGRSGTTGLTKFGIINLINAGVSDSVIKKLTGAEESVLRSCVESNEKKEAMQWEKYVNSRISKIDIYYSL